MRAWCVDQPRSARAARVVPVPIVEVSVDVPDVLGVVVVVVVVDVLGDVVVDVLGVVVVVPEDVVAPEPVAPEVLPLVPEVVPEVPEVLVAGSVVVVPLVVPLVVPEVEVPKLELLVVAGVPVPDGVVAPGDCDSVLGPSPAVDDVPDVPVDPDVPVPVWATDTLTAAARDATAAAMVKLFGSFFMNISCCRVKRGLLWVARYSAPRWIAGAPKALAGDYRASCVPWTDPPRRVSVS